MKILSGLILALALCACQFPATPPFTGDVEIAVGSGGMIARSLDHGETWEMGNQSKVWNGGKTDLVVDGNLQVNGELNKGRFAQIDAIASAVSQIQTQGFLGDLHVRGTLYQQLGQQWVGPIANPYVAGGWQILSAAQGNGVFVVGGTGAVGSVIRSTDNGQTWSGAVINNNFTGAAVYGLAYGDNVFLDVGSSGNMSRSTDLGVTWSALIANGFGANNIFCCLFVNHVFLSGGVDGRIERSIDGAQTWVAITGAANPFGAGDDILSMAAGDGVVIATTGSGKIGRSTDLGLTWTIIANPFGGSQIVSSTFGSGVFVVAGASSKVARSVDLAKTWGGLLTTPFIGAITIESACFNFGIFQISGNNGTSARSYDNGVTWGSIISTGAAVINAMASGTSNVVAVGTNGFIATAGWNAALIAPSNLSGVGKWTFIVGANGGALTLPAGGMWAWFSFAYITATGVVTVLGAQTGASVNAGGTTIVNGVAGQTIFALVWRVS